MVMGASDNLGLRIMRRRFGEFQPCALLACRPAQGPTRVNHGREFPMSGDTRERLRPRLMSFDVFGTLVSVRDSSYGAFERILADARATGVDVKAFWEYWEHRNIAHYWEPYRTYREICALSLDETLAHFG